MSSSPGTSLRALAQNRIVALVTRALRTPVLERLMHAPIVERVLRVPAVERVLKGPWPAPVQRVGNQALRRVVERFPLLGELIGRELASHASQASYANARPSTRPPPSWHP